MTVCVFDWTRNVVVADRDVSSEGICVQAQNKIAQWEHDDCVYTAMTCGGMVSTTAMLDYIYDKTTGGTTPIADATAEIERVVGTPCAQWNSSIGLIVYVRTDGTVRVFEYYNSLVPSPVHRIVGSRFYVTSNPAVVLAIHCMSEFADNKGVELTASMAINYIAHNSSYAYKHWSGVRLDEVTIKQVSENFNYENTRRGVLPC